MEKTQDINCKIYQVHHLPLTDDVSDEDRQIQEKLKQFPWVYFNAASDDNEYTGSLNHLNTVICEFTALHYVWSHNLYSEYIGFCQYNKFKNIQEYCLKNNFHVADKFIRVNHENNGQEITLRVYFYANFKGFLYNDLMKFLQLNYSTNSRVYRYLTDNTPVKWVLCNSFIVKWEYFTEITKCVFNFLRFIAHQYKFDYNDLSSWQKFIDHEFNQKLCQDDESDKVIYLSIGWWVNPSRVIAYIIEVIIGVYLGHIEKEFYPDSYNKLSTVFQIYYNDRVYERLRQKPDDDFHINENGEDDIKKFHEKPLSPELQKYLMEKEMTVYDIMTYNESYKHLYPILP